MPSPMITVYEDYATPQEKRAAQKGAQRGKPTGKARGFMFVFTCNGTFQSSGAWCYEATGPLLIDTEPGCDLKMCPMAGTSVSVGYLRENCRKVGMKNLPADWKKYGEDCKK